MSYSALTSLGVEPTCALCQTHIVNDDRVVTVLGSTAHIVPHYNEENELTNDEVTVSFDYNDEETFHQRCYLARLRR